MGICKMGVVEERFARIIWQNAPISSGELVRLSAQALGWKKSTTYTVLKKLCGHGIFQNRSGTVTALITQAEYNAQQGEEFLEKTYGGSLPAFIAAFTAQRPLSEQDILEIRGMIDAFGKED